MPSYKDGIFLPLLISDVNMNMMLYTALHPYDWMNEQMFLLKVPVSVHVLKNSIKTLSLTLVQTSSVDSKMFPKNGFTAALETSMSIPPHCSTVCKKHNSHIFSPKLLRVLFHYSHTVSPS